MLKLHVENPGGRLSSQSGNRRAAALMRVCASSSSQPPNSLICPSHVEHFQVCPFWRLNKLLTYVNLPKT
jgi:hypothetical protein